MVESAHSRLIEHRYRDAYGATVSLSFGTYLSCGVQPDSGAVLGYERAGDKSLFLECYLDEPIEQVVSKAFGRSVSREAIVEIGNFAADNALAMVNLWGTAANDLGAASEIAVATLTAPIRSMFARIGLPVRVLAPARPECIGSRASDWGSYYANDPQVCAGLIAEGQAAIAAFLERRSTGKAA